MKNVVWIAGIVFAVRNRFGHPRISLLTVCALSLMLFISLVRSALFAVLPRFLRDSGMSIDRIGLITSFITMSDIIISATLWVFILLAIFMDRGRGENRAQ